MTAVAASMSSPELERHARFDTLREPWSDLAAQAGNLFGTWEWNATWWRHFGEGEPELWTCRRDGVLSAVLALCCRDGLLRFVGHPQGDRLGPVARPADLPWAAGALAALLRSGDIAYRRFRGDDLPADVDWTVLGEATVVSRLACPVVRLAGLDWQAYLDSRGRNLRALAARCDRLLARRDVAVRLADDPDGLGDDLDVLFDLHDRRWAGHGHEFAHRSRAFHAEFAALALERGWLRLRRLEIAGRPAAALLSFRFAGAEWFYQGGRDPAFDAERPGWALHLHALREGLDDGLSAYRLLRGGEAYKGRLADADEPVVTVELERPAA